MMTLTEAVEHAQYLLASGRDADCEAVCDQIVKIQRNHPMANFLIGKASERRGDRSKSAEHHIAAALVLPYNQEFVDCALRTVPRELLGEVEKQIEEARSTIRGFENKPSLRIFRNKAGRFAVPLFPDDDVITQSIVAGTVFEPEIVEIARQYIRPGTVAIDVGANFGQMTMLFSGMVGPEGAVYSIEADDYVHHVLTTNIALNGAANVTALQKAAHERDGEVVYFPEQDFVKFHTYGSYGIAHNASVGRRVETMTIDSLNIQREVSFMKVDVQGCDLFAMRGAVETIAKHKMPIIFEYEEQFQDDFQTCFDDYVNFVREIGYRFVKTVKSINYVIAPR